MNNIEVIHIGKCGGSTVRSELQQKKIKFSQTHLREAKYNKDKNYIIVIRNPIKRFISGFYWRYKLVCDDKTQEHRFKNEKDILNKYKNVDNLCNDLKINPNLFNSGNYIRHLKEDIYFYLHSFIEKCPKKQILGVICTETMEDDMKNIFDINISLHHKNNNKYNKTITNDSFEILKTHLKNDYMIIEKMYKYGWITNKQYNILKL
jgi:hypothetical protein